MQQYQKLIYTVCLQFVHEPHTAEDLTQDTFLSAFSAIDRCEPQYYKQWLVRVAANKCKDHLKSALLPQQPAARQERFGTKFNTAVNGFYKSLDDTFKSFTLTAENGLDQIRAQSIGGSTAKGE